MKVILPVGKIPVRSTVSLGKCSSPHFEVLDLLEVDLPLAVSGSKDPSRSVNKQRTLRADGVRFLVALSDGYVRVVPSSFEVVWDTTLETLIKLDKQEKEKEKEEEEDEPE